MTITNISEAQALLEEASEMLPDVTRRKMFGVQAVFAREAIYGLISPPNRIALRLSDPALYQELLGLGGAEPWRFEPDSKPVKHWVLVPESFYSDFTLLEKWVKQAYDCALVESAKPKKSRSKRSK